MNRHKLLLYISIIVSGVVFVTLALSNFSRTRNQSDNTPSIDPEETQLESTPEYYGTDTLENSNVTIPTSERIEIENVTMDNFIKEYEVENVYGDVILAKESNYSIIYHIKTESFLISITQSPFDINRALAENALQLLLDISKDELCMLAIDVTTPQHVDETHAGKVYDVSFCK